MYRAETFRGLKKLLKKFENETLKNIKYIDQYYNSIHEISENILNEFCSLNDLNCYIRELELQFIDLNELPIALNHIKLFTGIKVMFSDQLSSDMKLDVLRNKFFNINFDFKFLPKHYLLQINEHQFETKIIKNKLIELKQTSKSSKYKGFFEIWGKDVYDNLNIIIHSN